MHSPDPRSRMNMNPVAHGNHNMMMVGGGGGSANLHSSIKMEGQQQSLQDVVSCSSGSTYYRIYNLTIKLYSMLYII